MGDNTYRVWELGNCVCCSGTLDSYVKGNDTDGYEKVECSPIAEDILICGRCTAMEHLRDPTLLELVLMAVATRDDTKLYDALGLYEWTDGNFRSWPEDSADVSEVNPKQPNGPYPGDTHE